MPPFLKISDQFRLDLEQYARTGLRIGIWASSGRGKSYGVGVLAEELLNAGFPVVALDPEGELHTLREAFRVLVLGGGAADLPLPAGREGARLALETALNEGLGLVVDLSGHVSPAAQQKAALPWLEELWSLQTERRTPVALVVEEVHVFAPQSGGAVTADVMQRYAKQGRKRGTVLVAASQRTQAVAKEFMSQLNFPAIGGFELERDYDAVKALVGEHDFDTFRALPPGCFYLPAAHGFYRWRTRLTAHGGDTPAWGPSEPPAGRDAALDRAVAQLAEALRQAAARAAVEQTELTRAREQVAELEHQVAALTAQVRDLSIALRVAGVLQAQVVVRAEPVTVRFPAIPVATAATACPAEPPSGPGGQATSPVAAADSPSEPASGLIAAAAGPDAPAAGPAAPVAPAPSPPPPAPPLQLSPAELVQHSAIKVLARRARDRVYRRIRSRSYTSSVLPTLSILARGAVVTPADLIPRLGLRPTSQTLKRLGIVLQTLVDVGLARAVGGGSYRLHEERVRQILLQGLA